METRVDSLGCCFFCSEGFLKNTTFRENAYFGIPKTFSGYKTFFWKTTQKKRKKEEKNKCKMMISHLLLFLFDFCRMFISVFECCCFSRSFFLVLHRTPTFPAPTPLSPERQANEKMCQLRFLAPRHLPFVVPSWLTS